MGILENILTIAQVFVGLLVVVLVLLQEGKDDGNIVVGNKGGAMGVSNEAKLAKLTRIIGVAYIILTIASGSIMLINR